jgi:protein-tyrosine phosphatase
LKETISVLVVCTGNICRSPTGEGVMRELAKQRGLEGRVRIESRGTHDYHLGEAPDPRAIEHARGRGYDLSRQRASQVGRGDFEEFDYILAMDDGHLRMLRTIAPRECAGKIRLFLDASGKWKGGDVPDPYYGGPDGFERVLDMVEEAGGRWLDRIEAELSDPASVPLAQR